MTTRETTGRLNMAQAAIGSLDEVHLNVEDLEGMRLFYTDVLGFEEEFYHEGEMIGFLTGGAALVLTASKTHANGVALALGCTDIEALLDGLVARGVTITRPLWEGHWGPGSPPPRTRRAIPYIWRNPSRPNRTSTTSGSGLPTTPVAKRALIASGPNPLSTAGKPDPMTVERL